MKIYQTIQEAKENEIIALPGIYYFRNKITNKYYVGQAINIRKRFSSHYIQIKKENKNYPIYRAIIKYGVENFEYGIIEILEESFISKKEIKDKLDLLEKKYIEEYNSYNDGYNQTLGGDGGILGYKMTEEQIKHISENSKRVANDGRNTMYVYDVKEKKEYTFSSFQVAADFFNIERDGLYSACRRNGIYMNRYIPRKNKEDLYNKNNNIKSTRKIQLEDYIRIKNNHPNLSAVELAKLLGVCKKTIYNYEHVIKNEV